MRRAACFFAVAALAVSGPGAQVRDLGEVSVTAESWSPEVLAPGGSVVVVTARDIEASGAKDAAAALEFAAGFSSADYGYPGSVRTPSLRGAASGQVLVIVDGVRLNDARSGNVDLAQIPAESIERIEILKGGASSLYGADAVGGVIVVTTKRGGDPQVSITAESRAYPAALGSGAEYLAAGQHLGVDGRTRIGAVSVNAAAAFDRAGDSFPAVDEDGSVLVRDNTDILAWAASFGAQTILGEGVFDASLSGRWADMGSPGSLPYAFYTSTPNARQANRDLRGTASWTNDALAGGRLVLSVSGFGAWSRMSYVNPDTSEDSLHDTASAGTDVRIRAFLFDFLEAPFGAEFRYDGAESTNLGEPRSRIHAGSYLAPVVTLGKAVSIAPSVRFDWYDDYPAGTTYALGVSAALSEAVVLKWTGGRSYRAPSFNDLYWDDPWTPGNPDLLPETSWYGECGGEAALGAFKASLYAFARYTEDLIQWGDPDGDGTWQPENLDAAAFFGTDAAVSLDLGRFGMTASYAFLLSYDLADGRTLSDDMRVANMPVHTIKLEPSFASGPVQATVRASWRSARFVDVGNGWMDPVFLLGARIQYGLTESFSVYLDGDNLLNQAYAEVYKYPMPGITLKTGVRIVLD